MATPPAKRPPGQVAGERAGRWPAIAATVLALVLVNLAVASTLASAVGASATLSASAGLVIGGLGLVCAAAAVLLWRRYLQGTGRPR